MSDISASKDKILVIMSHPDDETFAIGGTIAYYAGKGIPVHLICATLGEAGEMDAKYLIGGKTIADVRKAELLCAAEVLGISSISFLGYLDSGMPGMKANENPMALVNRPEEEVIATVIGKLNSIQPTVVITFDEIGGYPHPDHIYLHHVVKKAFHLWLAQELQKISNSTQPPKLFYYTISRRIIRWMVRLFPIIRKNPKKFGLNADIDLTTISGKGNQIHTVINYQSFSKIRRAACSCYASQGGMHIEQGAAGLLRGWEPWSEFFEQAFPERNTKKIAHDLFEIVE